MKLLEERILSDGKVFPGNVLKVDSFLNHQLDVELLAAMGAEIKRLFASENVTKILTIEASGIAIAVMAAQELNVPVLFAKKSKTSNQSPDVYSTAVASFTHGNVNNVTVSKEYLCQSDRVLIIDDFLADGNAAMGLIDLCQQSKAEIAGVAIAIEKGFQRGGERIRAAGVRLESLAVIDSMSDSELIFR